MRTFKSLGLIMALLFLGCQSSRTERVAQAGTAKPGTADSQSTSAFAELEGAWVAERIVSAGETVPKEKFPYEVHFKPPNQVIHKGITIGNVTGRDSVGEITLDASKKPAVMDMTRAIRGTPQTARAIYKIEGDLLSICFLRGADGKPSSERPTGFESSEVRKSDLMVLKRKAKAKE